MLYEHWDHRKCYQSFFTFPLQAPVVTAMSIQKVRVEVKGQTFHLTEERKIQFKPKPAPITFIQSSKPIYTPGQTGKLRENPRSCESDMSSLL